jgi:hypothetical protein
MWTMISKHVDNDTKTRGQWYQNMWTMVPKQVDNGTKIRRYEKKIKYKALELTT